MKKYALCGWASGEEFCRSEGFKIFLKSLDVLENVDIHIFTHSMPFDIMNELGGMGIDVHNTNHISYLLRDRHFHYWNWLNSYKYEGVGFVDTRDVLFQSNPFENILFENRVFLVSEGMTHSESDWNMKDQFCAQKNVHEFRQNLMNEPVINGGILFGDPVYLSNHLFLLWTNTLKSDGCTDQGVLNYLYSFLKMTPPYWHNPFCPKVSNFCLTGEAVKCGFVPLKFEDGLFMFNDKPYCIVHQYDRISSVYDQVVKKYA